MSTDIRNPSSDEAEDRKAAIQHAFKGKPMDPEISKRIRERAAAIRARLPETNIAVELLRDSRDDL